MPGDSEGRRLAADGLRWIVVAVLFGSIASTLFGLDLVDATITGVTLLAGLTATLIGWRHMR